MPSLRLLAALFTVWLVWGSTYYAIRLALTGFGPFWMAALRLVAAAVVLLAWGRARGEAWPSRRQWGTLAGTGVLMFLLGNGTVVWSEQSLSSAMVAILVGAVPLIAAVIGRLRGATVLPGQWLGIGLGMAGLVVLNAGEELRGNALTVGVMLVGATGWALGSVLARGSALPGPSVTAGGQMLFGGLALGLAALVSGEALPVDPSRESILAVLYLFSFGSILAFSAYNYVLRNASLPVATSYAYMNPLVAVALGAWLGDEHLDGPAWLGLAMILAAVVLVTLVGGWGRPRPALQ